MPCPQPASFLRRLADLGDVAGGVSAKIASVVAVWIGGYFPSQIRVADAGFRGKFTRMTHRFSKEVLMRIVEQAMIYQCACPAQICKAISQVRELYAYQQDCLTMSDTDKAVHERIAATCARNHGELEQCLEDVLKLEGWDLTTYEMPSNLDKLPRV